MSFKFQTIFRVFHVAFTVIMVMAQFYVFFKQENCCNFVSFFCSLTGIKYWMTYNLYGWMRHATKTILGVQNSLPIFDSIVIMKSNFYTEET